MTCCCDRLGILSPGTFAFRRKDLWSWVACFPRTTRRLQPFRHQFAQSFSPDHANLLEDTRKQLCAFRGV